MTYTIPQLCARWGLSDDTIRRRVADGRLIPLPRQAGEAYRFLDFEVERFESGRKLKSRAAAAVIPDVLGIYGAGVRA